MTYASCTICGSDLRPSYARTCPESVSYTHL